MRRWRKWFHCWMLVAGLTANHSDAWASDHSEVLGIARGVGLSALVYAEGSYAIAAPGTSGPVIRSQVGAVVDAVDLSSAAYPHNVVERSEGGSTLTVTHSGLVGRPDLVCVLQLRPDQPWGAITVEVANVRRLLVSEVG